MACDHPAGPHVPSFSPSSSGTVLAGARFTSSSKNPKNIREGDW
jgi:hypothetical protein